MMMINLKILGALLKKMKIHLVVVLIIKNIYYMVSQLLVLLHLLVLYIQIRKILVLLLVVFFIHHLKLLVIIHGEDGLGL